MKFIKTMFLLLASLLLVSIAYATPPTSGSGSFELVNATAPVVKHADGNTIGTFSATFNLTGIFNGTAVEDVRQVIKSTGEGTAQGLATFYGTVNGVSGSMVFRIEVKIDGSVAQGQFVIQNGTGGLANLHGHGTFDQIGNSGTYSAQIHFDPE